MLGVTGPEIVLNVANHACGDSETASWITARIDFSRTLLAAGQSPPSHAFWGLRTKTEAPMQRTLYGIPTCGTVRKARKWLDEHGIDYDWVDLRENPPDREQLETWLARFGFKPMRNTSGGAYRALGDEKKTWGDDEWLAAFAADAMLLKRPVLEIDGRPAAVGFKQPEWEALGL